MRMIRIAVVVLCLVLGQMVCFAKPAQPEVGAWIFSGTVENELGQHYGYFFQIERKGSQFHTKTALIDAQTNHLAFYYEGNESLELPSELNWHVGQSFLQYNPITESWIFGVKKKDNTGFNFKVDLLKQSKTKPKQFKKGLKLLTIETSHLNGHVQTEANNKEQFVTAKTAWFSKLSLSKAKSAQQELSTVFCRLNDDRGFYSARLKGSNAHVAGLLDKGGNPIHMSQSIGIKSLKNQRCALNLYYPKLTLNLINSLKQIEGKSLWVAGFAENEPKGFCFLASRSFA
jgi:hypothetical protein